MLVFKKKKMTARPLKMQSASKRRIVGHKRTPKKNANKKS